MGQAFEALLSALLPLLTRALPRDQNEAGGEEIRPGVFSDMFFYKWKKEMDPYKGKQMNANINIKIEKHNKKCKWIDKT